ncbi:MAG: sel1 repeat family protein [Candidatus Thioglobus sp.]|jgi:hypothetical protein|nr:sel1 repeat family protein [Candidatus Thioglobus sp.]
MKMIKPKILLVLLITGLISVSYAGLKDVKEAFERGDIKAAFELIQPIAEEGNVVAQYNLGMMYAEGDGTDVNNKKSAYWYTKAAEQGHKRAQNSLALMYGNGEGVEQDNEREFYWFEKSANQGHHSAQYNLASLYENKLKDYDKALYWYRKSASQGNYVAQYAMAELYIEGVGIEKDLKEARYWLFRVTMGEDNDFTDIALDILDQLNEEAGAKDKDNLIDKSLKHAEAGEFEEARKLIESLANNGNTDAQYLLSRYYRDSKGFNQPEIGEKWLYKAANNNNARAQYDIAWRYSAGWITADIEQVIKAVYWNERAGLNGDTRAYGNLAALYDKEHRDVLSEMEQVAYDGDAMAQYNMGWITARGLLSEDSLMQDRDVAKKWFEKSAKQDFEDAVLILKRDY